VEAAAAAVAAVAVAAAVAAAEKEEVEVEVLGEAVVKQACRSFHLEERRWALTPSL
jgi:hypothetical protein